ncbi:RNA polymerase sigma-70 factor (ECF subfamily) [Antricoccus suffuscus]|uniref:RNA polymerase sigma-70 factor (ECF subfamily) n=1 Tax=Antricoccus suffuscus TaxID=1629062 RepID=A0A2T0ZJQ7_9ACTN|nr:sigma-70 family RNA polymerase sigma factor [Antricoccus suffuscus]PRZ36582.1 RNA polymerase sigma-70 factor (ECF subfamily) [Antricoccus suffuscus]
MAGSMSEQAVVEAFEEHRGRLVAVAYRMLGSRADAEDAVQEAWLRLARQGPAAIDNLAGWLTTVVGRVCIDMLRSRKAKPEASYDDQRLPELVVTDDEDAPEDTALLAESVGLALLVVLDTLRPAERLALVLHDMFAVPFEEVGQIIGKSADASKMLTSRARRKVQGSRAPNQDRRRQRAVVDAFIAAAREGDFEGLLRVLDPDVRWSVHTPQGVTVKLGATELAAQAQRGKDAKVTARRVLVNGEPGIVAWGPTGKPLAVMACTVVDDRIVEVISVVDRERLAAMDLPGRPS